MSGPRPNNGDLHEAIQQYLEDCEDYREAIAALERREPIITLDELERRLGIDT